MKMVRVILIPTPSLILNLNLKSNSEHRSSTLAEHKIYVFYKVDHNYNSSELINPIQTAILTMNDQFRKVR